MKIMRKTAFFIFLIISFTSVLSAMNFNAKALKKAKGFSWKTTSSQNFTYYFEADSPAERDIENIKAFTEKGRSKAEELLAGSSDVKIEYFLVDSKKRMKEMTGGYDADAWNNGTVQASIYGEKTRAIGAHETVHCLSRVLWGKTNGNWLNDGLAVYADDQLYGLDIHREAKWLLDHGKLLPVSEMVVNMNWKKPGNKFYPQSGSFLKFIYEKYGISSVKEFWQKGIEKGTARIGKTLLQLEEEWLSELAGIDATGADKDSMYGIGH